MSDTRKEFEEWARMFMDKNERAPYSNEIWQACQQLNDKRIADLLALVAKKDEALMLQASHMEMYSLQISHANDYAKITRAIDLSPDDVELVEVATVNDHYSRDGYNDEISAFLPVDTKLYTIKQKYE